MVKVSRKSVPVIPVPEPGCCVRFRNALLIQRGFFKNLTYIVILPSEEPIVPILKKTLMGFVQDGELDTLIACSVDGQRMEVPNTFVHIDNPKNRYALVNILGQAGLYFSV